MRTWVLSLVVALAASLAPAAATAAPARCMGRAATIVGTGRPDVLRGTPGPDVIVGRGGGDRIMGRGGRDRICAGGGRDTVLAGPGRDRVRGGRGADVLDGGRGWDRIGGGGGADGCFRGRTRSCVPVVAAAGDIACDPGDEDFNGGAGANGRCRMGATARAIQRARVAAVLVPGDLQYEDGALWKFEQSWRATWGPLDPLVMPVPGNHEYGTAGADGYFTYFGDAAGVAGEGWHERTIGRWQVLGLNSNCGEVGCGPGSPQEMWLRERLAASSSRCTLAFWHHARFSSGDHGDDDRTGPFWDALYQDRADLVLAGHDHDYERFAPLSPAGDRQPRRGIRSFVVGTGGKDLRGFDTPRAHSQVRLERFGVLFLAFAPRAYTWLFAPLQGSPDVGRGRCA